MTGAVAGFFERAGINADAEGRYFTGYDLGLQALKALYGSEFCAVHTRAALGLLAKLDPTPLRNPSAHRTQGTESAFDVQEARQSCERHLARNAFRGRVATGVLCWIVESDQEDARHSFDAVRKVLVRVGFDPEAARDIEKRRRASIAVGTPVDPAGEIIDERDLNGIALIGRYAEISHHQSGIRQALARREHYLMTGRPGTGKTALARRVIEAVLRTSAKDTSPAVPGCVWIDKRDLLGAGPQAPERLEALAAMLKDGFVPVIDDAELLLSPNLPVSEDAIRVLGHELVAGRHTMVLVADEDQTRILAYLSHLTPHRVRELGKDDTAAAAAEHLEALAGDGQLVLGEPALLIANEIHELRRSNYADAGSPGAEIRLVEGTLELLRATRDPESAGSVLMNRDAVQGFVSRDRGLPRELVERDSAGLLARLRRELSAMVIGQDEAVETTARAVAYGQAAAGAIHPRTRLLFMGPPGVGKTELATSLAHALGYGEDGLVRLNMSEYSGEGARTRLLGADPGYVGFGTTRNLFEEVAVRPSCVILLDEVDRAHPSIQDLLLSVLEGEGVNARGRRVLFSQSIIIATTNLGQEQIEARWRQGAARGETRDVIARALDDDTLRELVLTGALDEIEQRMQQAIEREIEQIREGFREKGETGPPIGTVVDYYLRAQERRRALAIQRRHGSLDRAFLDRIDLVVGFLPILTPEIVTRIVNEKLTKALWEDCPNDVRQGMISHALENGSVRMIQRLISKRWIESRIART